ncbi:hypothetical protein [Paenibacillus thermotolerans]|uniref:hypothetical protein n=1 Tax=Paenibacillus thermotolerans TaxID=3027807 RepID=UPI002368EBBE|nr:MULTISPECIES: hypothetical protein [unclassified Paenibacillus]
MEKVSQSSAAWGLGLAACLCNLLILFLPVGFILGIVALVIGGVHSSRRRGTGNAGIVLGGLSLIIALIWIVTIGSVFVIDPTL